MHHLGETGVVFSTKATWTVPRCTATTRATATITKGVTPTATLTGKGTAVSKGLNFANQTGNPVHWNSSKRTSTSHTRRSWVVPLSRWISTGRRKRSRWRGTSPIPYNSLTRPISRNISWAKSPNKWVEFTMYVKAKWVFTRSVQKIRGLRSLKKLLCVEVNIWGPPSKYSPPPMHTLIPTVFPLLKTVLVRFFYDGFQFLRRICLHLWNHLKFSSFEGFLRFGNKKKSQGARSGE